MDFWKVTEGSLVRRSWVDGIRGEEMETFPEDRFEIVKARIISSDERQVLGV